MMMVWAALLLQVVASMQASAPPRPDVRALVLTELEGAWLGEGRFSGAQSRVSMTWEPAMHGAFTRMIVQVSPGDGAPPVFEAHGYYRAASGSGVIGVWSDTEGNALRIEGRLDGDSLVTRWAIVGGPSGMSVYRLADRQSLEVTDRIRGGAGDWKVFNTFRLSRQQAPR